MARFSLAALAALSFAAPLAAGAQFRQEPMVLRLPHPEMDVLSGNFSGSTGTDDLLLLQQGLNVTQLRPWHDLRRAQVPAFPIGWTVANGLLYRAGDLADADGLADVAAVDGTSRIGVIFGSAPATARPYAVGSFSDATASFLRLVPKPAGPSGKRPEQLVVTACVSDSACLATDGVVALDFDAAGNETGRRSWTPPRLDPITTGYHEAFPVRLSPTAVALGIDDIAVPTLGGVLLFVHVAAPSAQTLAGLNLSAPIMVGGPYAGVRPPWLPDTVLANRADALGVAAVDVDQDGFLDLVFTEATTFGVEPIPNGALLWVQGTGNPADLGNAAAPIWRDLTRDPALLLEDPQIVRGLELGGERAFAVWDRDLQEVLVVTPGAAGLQVWRAPAPGRRATDIRLVDLVGSPSPDLLVVIADPLARDSVLVYPDLGDASPSLAWAPGSPGAPVRGVAHAMAVDASDADGPTPTLEWMVGDPDGTPVSSTATYTHPAASLCALPPPDLAITVRATDDRGVFTELGATLAVAVPAPAIAIAGAVPPGRLVLPPGGTSLVLEGTAVLQCGASATWGGNWPAGASFVDEPPAGTSMRRTVILGEATYPELLAGTPVVTLTTTDPLPAPVATLGLDLDATGLVEVEQDVDRPALAAGEVAVLRTLVRSRLGLPLPTISVVDVLAGLAPAGAPGVSGAALVEVRSGGAVVVLDSLPPYPAEIEIELPVRSTGGGGASAVEVRSSGEHLLTPPARVSSDGDSLPGCGCGPSGGGGEVALLALLALVRRRRLHGDPRSR